MSGTRSDRGADRYPPIADYGFLSDCHSAALVSRHGSIDWCCMPRFDSASVFGRLLDWDRGGYFSIGPASSGPGTVSRRYVDGSLVLETTFTVEEGEVRLTDCFAMREGGSTEPRRELVRVVEGVRGSVDLRVELCARFDYGGVAPWIRRAGRRCFTAVGGNDALVVTADAPLELQDQHDLVADFAVRPGTSVRFSVVWARPEHLEPTVSEAPSTSDIDDHLGETVAWWRGWSSKADGGGAHESPVHRSAIVLKGLVNAPTGAVVAAPTTSLPEALGAGRNWDYRYSWIRDSQFTVRSLAELGRDEEADGFRRFIERSAGGSADAIQVVYGVGGERRLSESTIDDWEGYRGSAPVRVGNQASQQLQLDVFGYLLDLSWRWHRRGRSPDDDFWRFLVTLVDAAAEQWQEPDCGIWETRGDRRHFVHSKVMCWVALDRGVQLADECARRAPTRRWAKTRDEVRAAVEHDGYDDDAGTFVRAFGSTNLDAALLLLPAFDFVAYDDERMVRTTDAVAEQLDRDGLLLRYREDDGLDGEEGAFIACTFWLAECYARQSRLPEAQAAYDRAMSTANDLGLFSEEYDTAGRLCLGNFPQGLTHLSQVAAAVALAGADQPGV